MGDVHRIRDGVQIEPLMAISIPGPDAEFITVRTETGDRHVPISDLMRRFLTAIAQGDDRPELHLAVCTIVYDYLAAEAPGLD